MTKTLYKKRFNNKGHLKLATDLLKGFSPDFFNKSYVTDSKSNMAKNLEPKSELVTFF